MTQVEKAAVFESVDKIAAESGFGDKVKLNEAMASGMGVIGDVPTVSAAVSAAAPLAIHSPDELKDLARGALAVQRATGNTSPEANLGFLQSAAANAFIESNALVASRMTPVLGSALREVPNQDPKLAAADVAGTFAEVSKLLSDATGDITKSNTDKFFRELDKVFDAGQFPDPGTLRGRIQAAQANPDINAAVLKGFGENEGTGAIKALLDGHRPLRSPLPIQSSRSRLTPQPIKGKFVDQASLTPRIAIATAMKKSEARDTAFAESDDMSTVAAVRKIVDDTLKQAEARGIAGLYDNAIRTTFGTGIGPGPAPTGDAGFSISGALASIPRAIYNMSSQGGPQTGNEAIDLGVDRLKGQIEFLNEVSVFGLSTTDQQKIEELEKSIAILNELRTNREAALKTRDAAQQLNTAIPTTPPTVPVVTGTNRNDSIGSSASQTPPTVEAYPTKARDDMAQQTEILREIRDSMKNPPKPTAVIVQDSSRDSDRRMARAAAEARKAGDHENPPR